MPTVKSQQALVAQGVAGQPVTRPEKPSHKAAIVDIAKALQKSLVALKKPAAEQAARKDAKAAGTQRKKKIG
jgi:non-homologous end joining protein Ku